ncbi:MAG: transporter substrate-binding domain-containing protein, partial [Shewanellaceae bacterium]|nr:transporter substrate-binding domain-containing protein [Shewanellaceae bacterium]
MLLTPFRFSRLSSVHPQLRCSAILLLVFLLSSFLPIHIKASATTNPIKNILKVGTIYSSTSYVNEPVAAKNNLGFDYELSQKFANYLNATLQIIPYSTISDLLRDLRQHKIDLVAAGMTKTADRSKGFIYSPPLYQVRQQLIYKMGATKRPKSFKDLKGSILVTENSSHAALLELAQHKIPNLDWATTTKHNHEDLLMQVAQGKIKYTITDSSLLAIHRRYTPELGIGFSLTKSEDVVWILAKQKSKWLADKLLDFWSIELKKGTFEQLDEKYFGHIQRFDFVDTRAFIRAVKRTLPRYQKYFERYAGKLDWRKIAAT